MHKIFLVVERRLLVAGSSRDPNISDGRSEYAVGTGRRPEGAQGGGEAEVGSTHLEDS